MLMASEPKNIGTLFIIPTSIEQHENITFLLDEQKKELNNIRKQLELYGYPANP